MSRKLTKKVATSPGLPWWYLLTDLQKLLIFTVVQLLRLELDLGVGRDVAPGNPAKLEQGDLKQVDEAILKKQMSDSLFQVGPSWAQYKWIGAVILVQKVKKGSWKLW